MTIDHLQYGGQVRDRVVVALRLRPPAEQVAAGGGQIGVAGGRPGIPGGVPEPVHERFHAAILARRSVGSDPMTVRPLARLAARSRAGVRGGLHRVRGGVALALQAGLAAGLAWFVAHDLIGRPVPFFAPIAAVITLASSVGQRLRRTTELVIGVAIGSASATRSSS